MRTWNQDLAHILAGLLLAVASITVAFLLTSCSDSSCEESPNAYQGKDSRDGWDGITMNLQIHTADYSPGSSESLTGKSRKSGTRSTTQGIEGIPSGAIQILCFDGNSKFVGMARDVSNSPSASDGRNQSLRATVPSASTSLHILANANITANNSWLGKSEEEVMAQLESRYDANKHFVYWGHVSKGNITEMKEFLENSSNVVSLLRDRAKITVNNQDADIKEVSLTVCNAFASGKMLAVKSTPESASLIGGTTIEGYDLTQVNLPTNSSERIDGTEAEMAETVFAFEHPNRPGDYLRVILKAIHQDGTIRYHHICLENDLHEAYPILRNHEYRINLIQLDKDTGYADFDGAKNGEASNNAFISVDDIVPEISDGKHSLLIDEGTSRVYNAGASTEQVIAFTYQGGSDINASDFKATWIENNALATGDSPTLTYDAATGKGEIRYQLNDITDQLKTAKLHLLDTKHGLSRTIHLYSISQFTLQAQFQSTLGDNKLGKSKGGEGVLTIEIPADYPEDLLPVEIKIASNDINPKDTGVEVSSTADVDGSQQDSSITPWNCWFVYKANTTGSHSITIKNVRAASAGTSGKFFVKAKYFGEAKEIRFNYQ